MSKEFRYTYIFNQDVEVETVQELIDTIHNHDKVDLIFHTNGGVVYAMNALIKYLNNHPDINIYLTYQIYSCGFDIITNFTGKIFLTKDLDFFMVHAADRTSYQIRKYDWDVNTLNQYTKERNEDYCKLLKDNHNFTVEELSKIMNGEDVYIYRKDFKRVIGNNKNVEIL